MARYNYTLFWHFLLSQRYLFNITKLYLDERPIDALCLVVRALTTAYYYMSLVQNTARAWVIFNIFPRSPSKWVLNWRPISVTLLAAQIGSNSHFTTRPLGYMVHR